MADCAELDLDLDQELDQDLDRKPLDLEGPLKRDDSAGHCNDKLPSGDLDLILPVNPSRVTCTNPESTNTAKTNPVVAGSGSRLYNAAGQNSYIQSHDIDRFKYCTETELSSETPACSETPIEIIKSSSVLFEVEATSEALNVTTELAENREPCADAHYQEGSGTCESNNLQALPSSPPTSDSLSYSPNERVSVNKSMKVTVAFEVDFSSNTNTNEFREMPKKAKTSLQEAFLHFRKKRQDEIRQERRRRDAILEANADPVRMCKLREKIIAQAKRYFGVPYARKYWQPNTPEYNSPIFLDCCGLVRQVMRDLQDELGFRLGPWNQAYMFDTLPVTLTKRQMRPGDLVFMTGEYTNPKKKKQRHNMLHVEIWLGEGDKTIGSRWNNGKVSTFNSYKFDPKSFQNEQYIFKSIDTWLMGICHSYCSKHPWRLRKVNPSAKSIFNVQDVVQDEKASPDSDEEGAEKEDGKGHQLQQDGENSDAEDGHGGGGGVDGTLTVEDVALEITAASGDTTPCSAHKDGRKSEPSSRAKGVRMPSPRKFKTSLKNRIQATGSNMRIRGGKASAAGDTLQRQRNRSSISPVKSPGATHPSRQRRNGGNATVTMDHDATVLPQPSDIKTRHNSCRKTETSVGDLTLLRAAANRRITATIVTSVSSQRADNGGGTEGERSSSSVLREVTEAEIEYIPNRLPSRSGTRMANAWRTPRDREARASQKVIPVEHPSQQSGARIDVRASQRKAKGNVQSITSKGESPLSVVGSHDNLVLKNLPSSNTVLQSSETNLLFRSNTNFFQTNGANRIGPNGPLGMSDLNTDVDRHKQEGKEKMKWRLASRVSPEPNCGHSKMLDLNLVKEKLKDANLIDDLDVDSDFDSAEEDKTYGRKDDITSCLIIQRSPRIQVGEEKTSGNVLREKNGRGRGRGRGGGKPARGNAFKSFGKSKNAFNSIEADMASGRRSGPVFLSTSILQSALCLTPENRGDETQTVAVKTAPNGLLPVDDGSVVVRVGTASQLSSRQGPRQTEVESHQLSQHQHGVKHEAGVVTFGLSGNRTDGRWKNPSATSNVIFGSSKDTPAGIESGFHVNMPQKDNGKLSLVTRAGLCEVETVQSTHNVVVERTSRKNQNSEPQEISYVNALSLSDDKDQKEVLPQNIEDALLLEKDDDCDLADTSFSSDLSFDATAFSERDLAVVNDQGKEMHAVNACGDGSAAIAEHFCANGKREGAESRNIIGCRVGDGGDYVSSPGHDIKDHVGESQIHLLQEELDVDTDDEIESGLGITSLHKCYFHNKQPDIPSGPEDMKNVNHRMAVLGSLCEALQSNQRLNPAWEWLYSFPYGVRGVDQGHADLPWEGNSNNNSSVMDGLWEAGTSLFVRLEDDPYAKYTEIIQKDGNQVNHRRPLSSRHKALPPLHSRPPSATKPRKRFTLTDHRHGAYSPTARQPSHLLASYVLSQQPRCTGDAQDQENGESPTPSRSERTGDTCRYNNDPDVARSAHYTRLQTPLSDSGADSYNTTSDGRQSITSSLSTLEDAGELQQAYTESYFEKLHNQNLLLRKKSTSAWSQNCATTACCDWKDDNDEGQGRVPNNEGLSESKDMLLGCEATRAPCPTRSRVSRDSDVTETDGIPFHSADTIGRSQAFDVVAQEAHCPVAVPVDRDGGDFTASAAGTAAAGGSGDGCLEDEGPIQNFQLTPSQSSSSISSQHRTALLIGSPATPPRGSNTQTGIAGASAKAHPGKQSAGSQGGTHSGGAGDKPLEKQQTASDTIDGAGEEGGKGVGKGGGTGGGGAGGGGGKRPSRPPKLPQCCLPNNMQPTFYIGGGNGTALVEGPLLGLGWKRITDKNDERYKLKWVENKSRINYVAFREGEQLVNHIPNCKLLTNKLGLLCSLQEYERVTLLTKGRTPRMKMTDFIPETYKLDERLDREKFLSEYNDGETWICKPTSLNQGKGIFLLRSLEEITNLLSEREAKQQCKPLSRQPLMRIVQRYINKPMLLDNRKFDIRAYMMVASTVPFLVVFHQGYVRLSCQKYDQADTNLTTHLTNQFVQKKDPMYKDNKEDTAWTMDKFNDYINDHVAKEKGLDQDWVYGYLTKQMQRICLHCFNSVKHKLQCKIGYFDLYGLDFMVDDEMKVWLIEINANPALHTNCQALKDAIPPVVEHGLYLAIECFDKSRKGQPLLPLNSLADFSVLYCGASPNAHAPRQIRSVSPFKDAGEWGSRPAGTSSSTRRHSPPRNLPRMSIAASTTSASGATATTHAVTTTGLPTTVKSEKKEITSSILPTINIGTSLGQKSTSSGTLGGTASNSTSRQQQHHQQPHLQQREATLARVSLSGVNSAANEEQHRLRMTHADTTSSVRKSRDNPLRGN